MIRAAVIAAAATLLVGAQRPDTVDYRMSLQPGPAGQPGTLAVEIRLRGDADGETRLDLPEHYGSGKDAWRYLSDLKVKGATVTEDGPAFRVLRHKPSATLVITYRVQSAYAAELTWRDDQSHNGAVIRPDWFGFIGDVVFAVPDGRDAEAATFRWGALPRGWTAASDLEHGAMGRPMTVKDVQVSVALAGAGVRVVQRPITGGTLRVASLGDRPIPLDPLADQIAATISAERGFWKDVDGPFFVGIMPLTVAAGEKDKTWGGIGRGDGFALWSTPDQPELMRWTVAHEHTHSWIPLRVGRVAAEQKEGPVFWFTEGFADFFTNRTMLHAGAWTVDDVVHRMSEVMKAYDASPVRTAPNARIVRDFFRDPNAQHLAYQRGQLLALKWDEDIRRKTGGKADLTTAILRMRDHYQQFPPGRGPDVVTGLVSAVWVVAGVDLRPDIVRYVDQGQPIALPEEMFDGCLQARITVTPGFDAGFDAERSFATRTVTGVRPRGPAWNSGLRNGMALDSWSYKAGDMTRMIELTLRPAGKRAKQRKIAFWPYGDVDVQTRALQLTPGMNEAQKAACAKKIGGL